MELKIKAKTCDENFLEEIKRNFDTKYIDLYRNFDKKGIQKLFDNELVYDIEHEFEYLELFDPKSFSDLFTNNIKNTYEALKFLTPAQASREEFWFTMINTVYLDYLLDYLKTVSDRKDFDQKIKNSIFYNSSITKAQTIQRISRYWWLGYRTYDEKNISNPYWLTEYFFERDGSSKIIAFFSSNLTNNKDIALGIIEGIKNRNDKIVNNRWAYLIMNKYFNAMGGVRIIDIMTREEIKKETMKYIDYIVENPELLSLEERKGIIKG